MFDICARYQLRAQLTLGACGRARALPIDSPDMYVIIPEKVCLAHTVYLYFEHKSYNTMFYFLNARKYNKALLYLISQVYL